MKTAAATLSDDNLRALCQYTVLQAQDEPVLTAFCVTLDALTRCYEIVRLPHIVAASERAVMEAQLLGFGEDALKNHVEVTADQTQGLSGEDQDQAVDHAVRVMMQRIGRRQSFKERDEALEPFKPSQLRERLLANNHDLMGYDVTLGAIRAPAPTAG